MRRSLFWLLSIFALCLFAFPVSGQAYGPVENTEQIDSIVLTVAPSFGLVDELTNNVATIRPDNGTVLIETIRQKDDAVQERKLFRTQREDVTALLSSLYEHDFFSLPEYLETDVMDGDFTWVTVNLKNGESKRVGGLLADGFGPDHFIAICDAISRVLQNSIPSNGAYQKISAGEAYEMIRVTDEYILLDVRTDEEYKEKHIKGAVLIPDDEIGSRAETELPDKNALILIYCRSGRRSANAANELIGMGYTNVYDFGGIIDWPYDTVSE